MTPDEAKLVVRDSTPIDAAAAYGSAIEAGRVLADRVDELERALRDIADHQKLISGTFAPLSTTYWLTQRALTRPQ